jgi:circadian clock protein KaiB
LGLTALTENTKSTTPFIFELYIAGMTTRSLKTVKAVKAALEGDLSGKYSLEIIDIFKNPERTKKQQIMATPTLIRKSPQPQQAIVGNMSGRARILGGLNLWEQINHV